VTRVSAKKRTKLNKKTPEAKTQTKPLDKEASKTLEKMHNEVAQLSSDSKKASSSETPKSNDSYNIKSMTKLNNENLDNKPLKECQISPKFFKQLNGKERPNGTNPKNGISNPENGDMDDKYLRKELGENIVNAVESYFKKCKKQYFKYLLYVNSTEYKDKIKSQIQHEMSVKNELLFRKDKLEEQTSSLLKANVSLLKARAAELGIKDLKSPHELIEYAKEILTEHEDLVQKIKTMQQKVDSLQNGKNGKKLPESASEDKQQKNSAIYSKLLNVIDPKKANEAKGLKLPPGKKSEKENSELSAENKVDELKLPIADARSVGSNETLTATERGDDDIDNDDDLMSDNNKEQDSNESANLDSSLRRGEADLNESKSKSSPTSSSSSKDDKAENNNNSSKKTAKASYDKYLPKDANKSGENLRNFKIPKTATNAKARNKSPSGSPSNLSPNSSRKTSSEPNRTDKNKHKNEHSALHSPSSFTTDNQHKYMHPKKKYMMENSSNSSSSNMSYSNNFKHSSSDYNHHYNRSIEGNTDWGHDNGYSNRHGSHAFENYRNPNQNQISTSSSSSSNMSSSSSWSNHPRNSNNHYQNDYFYVNDSYHSNQRSQPFANTLVNPSSEGFANYAPNIGAKPTNSG
jgi:hypothetical protein